MCDFSLENPAPPLPRTYWVLDKMFLAGAYAGQPDPVSHEARVSRLFAVGMRTFINLMEEDETNNDQQPFVRYDNRLRELAAAAGEPIAHLRFPIVDRNVPTVDRMRSVLDAIDLSLAGKRPVYLHCFGGIGRTGTTVCCWLLRHGLATPENVFSILQQLRTADEARAAWPAPENAAQRTFVLQWQEQ